MSQTRQPTPGDAGQRDAGLRETSGDAAGRSQKSDLREPHLHERDTRGPDSGGNSRGLVGRRWIHQGRKYSFEMMTYAAPDGGVLEREVVRHPGAVAILPLLGTGPDRRVVMIRNERIALEQRLLEIPAGTREAGEAAGLTAGRELIEETGYEAATIEELCRFYTSPGLTDELMHAFVARDLRHVGQDLEADERITVELMTPAEVLKRLDGGEITDAKTCLVLLTALRRGIL
ncbi:MAG: NUDIX hydrolase [Planctomycetota bacterium]|nr:NUDIX hydrolase [Planctomycetota bacterium]